MQSALERLGNGCKKREPPAAKRGRMEVPVAALGVRPEPEEEPRAKGLKRVTNIFTAVEEPEGLKGEESEDG